ncbi:unnamed protein product, partial [Callosobruchus maculatus]
TLPACTPSVSCIGDFAFQTQLCQSLYIYYFAFVTHSCESHAKDAVSKELSNLRALIQNVTKTTSPLGKLMNYLHEDIDAMYSELEMWTNTRKQLYSEIKKKKKLNDDSMKPMHENLNRLQEDINKLQQEILSVQSTIIRNDLRINELLSK